MSVGKLRAKDAVNTLWWLSKSDFPKSNISNVLTPYSESMRKFFKNQEKQKDYVSPSGHTRAASKYKDNGGAIPSNLLSLPTSDSSSQYHKLCRELNIDRHPARSPEKLPEFFIKFLTEPGDTVVDIFAGPNTTGHAAEVLKRKWMSFELSHEYVAASVLRFVDDMTEEQIERLYNKLYLDDPSGVKI